eukprot:365911-Chlamydomonas_euryale.AAC.5
MPEAQVACAPPGCTPRSPVIGIRHRQWVVVCVAPQRELATFSAMTGTRPPPQRRHSDCQRDLPATL